MLKCEDTTNFPALGMPDPDYCFNGTRTREMSDEDFEFLASLRKHQNDIRSFLFMEQQQIVLGEDMSSISQMTQNPLLYHGKLLSDAPVLTMLEMEKTQLIDHSSFWLGSLGYATN